MSYLNLSMQSHYRQPLYKTTLRKRHSTLIGFSNENQTNNTPSSHTHTIKHTSNTSDQSLNSIFECGESIKETPMIIENLDTKDCSPLDDESIQFLLQLEASLIPSSYYFQSKQQYLNQLMRSILLDWLMEVCCDFYFKRETFHLACNYIDRYLDAVPDIKKSDFQLVGVSALLIASKFEEVKVPSITEYSKATNNAYSCQQITEEECNMCKVL